MLKYLGVFCAGFVLVVILMSAAPHVSAHTSRLGGDGKFSQSCSGIALNDSTLYARCTNSYGILHKTRILLDERIMNDDGNLVYNYEGNFSQSCANLILLTEMGRTVLQADCKQGDGVTFVTSTIDLDFYINNTAGSFEWV